MVTDFINFPDANNFFPWCSRLGVRDENRTSRVVIPRNMLVGGWNFSYLKGRIH